MPKFHDFGLFLASLTVIAILIGNWIKMLCHAMEEVLCFNLSYNMSPYVDNKGEMWYAFLLKT